jgi:hypothetical protein
MHSRELPLVGNAKKRSKKKKKRGGWVLLDGFCTCTWALIFFFPAPLEAVGVGVGALGGRAKSA